MNVIDSSETPLAIGSPPRAFQIALEALKQAGSKTVLDCPAGEGPFSKMLYESGFNPTCCDIFPDQFKVPELTCTFCDLNEKVPHDDACFDAVTCLNGLERVWARGGALKEIARVVKPGGTIVISYPNQGDMRRRMMNFVTGSVTWNVVGPPHVCDPYIDPPASNFRYAMTTANVLSGLESVGVDLVSIKATHYKKGSLILAPLAPIPMLAAVLASPRQKKTYFLGETSSIDALFGAFLVVVGKKNPDWQPKDPGKRMTNR